MDKIKFLFVGSILLLFNRPALVSSVQFLPEEITYNEQYQRMQELRPLAVEFLEHYKNISQTDLGIPSNRLPSEQDMRCLADLAVWMQAITSVKLWAILMIDSWGSFPKGMLYGNIIDMGNFDECIGINKAVTDSHSIRGQYCAVSLPVPVDMRIGICFPSTCNAAQLDPVFSTLLKKLLNVNFSTPVVKQEYCKTSEEKPLDGLTIFTIVLLSVFCALALLATLLDYLLYVDQTKLPAVVKAFSIRANSRALFRLVEPKSNPNVIDCLHGIRCMSLIWVIFGHQYIFAVMAPNMNAVKMLFWVEKPFNRFIAHAQFSVDTFFFLSGMLLGLIALRTLDKTKGKLNVGLMYVHRYLRLTPALAVAILMYVTLCNHITDGPVADKARFESYDDTKKNWFWTLLYVQNYATKEMCVSHSWYLAVDMQLYILSPIFLIALYKWGKKAAAGIFVLMLLLSACLFTTMLKDENRVSLAQGHIPPEVQFKVYFATHTHAAPWLIGLLFGYFLHVNRNKSFNMNRLVIWIGWIVSLALIFTSLFALCPASKWKAEPLTNLEQASYYTLTRIAWPLSLCWVVFVCMKGHGGLADSFLSSPLWQPLSKLSYCTYIFHIFIQQSNARRIRAPTIFSDYQVMLNFWQNLGFVLILSYVMYMIIEAPLGALEGMLMPQRKPKPKTEEIQPAPIETVAQKSNATEVEPVNDVEKPATTSEQIPA